MCVDASCVLFLLPGAVSRSFWQFTTADGFIWIWSAWCERMVPDRLSRAASLLSASSAESHSSSPSVPWRALSRSRAAACALPCVLVASGLPLASSDLRLCFAQVKRHYYSSRGSRDTLCTVRNTSQITIHSKKTWTTPNRTVSIETFLLTEYIYEHSKRTVHGPAKTASTCWDQGTRDPTACLTLGSQVTQSSHGLT